MNILYEYMHVCYIDNEYVNVRVMLIDVINSVHARSVQGTIILRKLWSR